MTRAELGIAGENCAATFLDRKGYVILERNFSCSYGEIDIVARDGETLCFIEVKTRTRTDFGLPCQAVNRHKLQHIKRCAWVYLRRHQQDCRSMRIDIVEVLYRGGHFYGRLLKNCGI